MDEYGNLQEWARRTSGAGSSGAGVGAGAGSTGAPRKRVVYGSTELVNAQSFLQELARLGRESA